MREFQIKLAEESHQKRHWEQLLIQGMELKGLNEDSSETVKNRAKMAKNSVELGLSKLNGKK